MGRARASGSLLLLVCTSTLALLLGQGWSAAVVAGTIAQSGTVEAQCGRELGGVQCNGGLCCSQYGFCGSTAEYCGRGCQSGCDGPLQPCREQAGGRNVCPLGLCCSPAGFCERRCPPPSPAVPAPAGGGLAGIVSAGLFDSLFPRRDGLYSYTALLQAAASFPGFATSGGEVARRREVAAFFAHITEETSGLFYTREISRGRYCNGDAAYPCYADKDYYGRGPLQLKWNYNYGRAGSFLGLGLAREPDLLATNPLFSFQASIWFWMTPLDGRPSCHEVITGAWVPGERDRAAGREPGFGLTTNILHGGTSCGTSSVTRNDAARAASYQRIANVLSVDPGAYRNCHLMQAYPEP